MTIGFYCGDSLEKWSPKNETTGIGGSEEAVINMARALARLGHDVTVWNKCQDDAGVYDGVKYVDFLDYQDDEVDVYIGWRVVAPWKIGKNYRIGYHWLHDTTPETEVSQALALGAHKVMVLSDYHRRLYPGIFNDQIYKTRNGINVAQFDQLVERVPGRIFWGSSYDRGLKKLLEHWPKIKLEHPEAELRIAYGWQTWETLAKKRGDDEYQVFCNLKQAIEDMMGQEGVTHLGRISHQEVANELLSADIWGYPTWWPEISCITAIKAQAAGAIPVVIPTAALAQTVRYGFKTTRGYYTGLGGGTVEPEEAIDEWVAAMNVILGKPEPDKAPLRQAMQTWARDYYDWATIAKEWVAEFEKELR